MPASLSVTSEGITETLGALNALEKDLRKEANAEIRTAARHAAGELAAELRRAAASSPTPVARRVAAAITVVSDRYPTVKIGGSKRVGRRGAIAARLVWGSEHGGEKFGAPAGGSYWIAPAVRRYEAGGAVAVFRRALYETIKRHGLN